MKQPNPVSSQSQGLVLPRQTREHGAGLDFTPAAFSFWLEELPLVNANDAAVILERVLAELHETRLSPAVRFQVMELLRRPVDEAVTVLRRSFREAAFPFLSRHQDEAQRVQRLMQSMACGYRVLLQGDRDAVVSGRDALQDVGWVIQRAIHYLSRMMLDSYRVKTAEPAGAWFELHRLYQHLHTLAQDSSVNPGAIISKSLRAAEHEYKRAVMMALANPYHLTASEADLVFHQVREWAPAVVIRSPENAGTVTGCFFISLDSDFAPTFGFNNTPVPGGQVRILSLEGFKTKFDQWAVTPTDSGISPPNQGFSGRLLQGTRAVISKAWFGRSRRRAARSPVAMHVGMVFGLGACYHHISGGSPFEPAEVETEIARGMLNIRSPRARYDLTPKDSRGWGDSSRGGSASSNATNFMRDERDVWDRIYANASELWEDAEVDEQGEAVPAGLTWQLRDLGLDGFSVVCEPDASAQLRVGDVLAFSDTELENWTWQVGMARWVQVEPKGSLRVGIERMSGNAHAVAVRGIRGAGNGSDYMRGLLVAGSSSVRQSAFDRHATTVEDTLSRVDGAQMSSGSSDTAGRECLLVPAGLFDVGSHVVVNDGADLLYARFTMLVETTQSCARFLFEQQDVPASEVERFRRLAAQLGRSG